MNEQIKVTFVPVYANPYQHLLTAALQSLNVQIHHLKLMPTFLWLLKHRYTNHILHLHWLDGLYMWRFLTPLYVINFVIKIYLSQLLGYKIVWTAHNLLPHGLPFPPLHKIIRRLIMKCADAVIIHCDYGKQELLSMFPRNKPMYVIPHGNYAGVHPITMTRSQARKELNIHNEHFVYLLLGNIAPYKGIHTFIDIFSKHSQPNDIALIAGRNRAPQIVRKLELMAETNQQIRVFTGFISVDAMQKYLLAADVAFFAFENILTSGTVILAMSYGLPIIAPAMGCLPELISSDIGILYKQNNSDEMASALKLIKALDLTAMSKASASAAAKLEWSKIALQTYKVYQECLKG